MHSKSGGEVIRAFPRASHLLVDLTNRAEVIREVSDAGDHPGEFYPGEFARRAQRFEPAVCFGAEAVADLIPRRRVDGRELPGFVPLCIGERISALGYPLIHEREPVTNVLRMRRD